MTFLIATLIALPIAALLLCVVAMVHRISQRRVFRELATFSCPYCLQLVGLDAISDGRDYTPFAELWILQGKLVHCHPICRGVNCKHCGECVVIRLNREGERFGPRLSVDNSEQIARNKAMPHEQLAEMKKWLIEYKNRRRRS